MGQGTWIIELGRTSWRLHASDAATDATSAGSFAESELLAEVEKIWAILSSSGYRGEPVVVALASCWCLTATLDVNRPRELRDRKTMLYRFEECIPWSAEEIVVDYIKNAHNAMLVAVPASPLADFFRQLETSGIVIQSISPLAILAATEHIDAHQVVQAHLVACEHGGLVDLVSIDAGHLQDWSSIPSCSGGLVGELRQRAITAGGYRQLIGYALSDATISELKAADALFVEQDSLSAASVVDLLKASATKISSGTRGASIEFKRDAFGRSGAHVALRPYALALHGAVACLVIAVTAALFYRGVAASREAQALSAQQVEIYRQVFPNTKVPVGVKTRLESELIKLQGLIGNDATLQDTPSAALLLRELLTALPTDRRFILHEIRAEEGRLYLDGEVREHGDAELISQRLRTRGFEVSSPRTQRLDEKRVALRVTATRQAPVRLAAKKGT